MRARNVAVVLILTSTAAVWAQGPQVAAPAERGESTPLPVRRVVLYKTGVGYFEHLGNVRDRQDVAIRFTSAQLNDVLKSLTTLDLGKGRISGISYNSIAPVEQRLGALRLPIGASTTTFDLLGSLRGARIEVTSGGAPIEGRLLSVERRPQIVRDQPVELEAFSLVTDAGEVRTFDLTPAVRVRIVDRDLRQEVARYLDIVGSSREQDVRRMVISTAGAGDRQLFVSYISEVPIWKSTYRLVLTEKGKPLLQGWAIIDNTIGEDWTNVDLSLVAGAPQSFIQQISQPHYGRRPVVALPTTAQVTPQTHQATLSSGMGRVAGRVRDASGGALPGVRVTLTGAGGMMNTSTNASGEYDLSAMPGDYSLRFELEGFRSQLVESVHVSAGTVTPRHATLGPGSIQETVTVTTSSAIGSTPEGRGGVPRSRVGGVVGGIPEAPPPPATPLRAYDQAQNLAPVAQGTELGDLFEYRIKEPVTLRKNQSALVPIVSTEVTAERVVLWNRASGSGRPLRAVWLSNATGYTLDGGSITVIDANAFAGEGLIEPLKPGERRLVSYAAELGVLVNAKQDSVPGRVMRVRASNGVVVHDMEERATSTYTVRNENQSPITLVIEHRLRPGWKLAEGPAPAETTADSHRFRVSVDSRGEATVAIREARATQTSISITELTDQYIASGMRGGFFAEDLQRALKPVIDKRIELAAVDRQIEQLRSQQQSIVTDQERLRENMKALRGSPEEKQLLQRYTRQLDEQENRLEELRRDHARVSARRDALRAELSALIEKLSFTTTTGQ